MTPQECANTQNGDREKNFDPLARITGRYPGAAATVRVWRRRAGRSALAAGALVLAGCGAEVAIASGDSATSESARYTVLEDAGSGYGRYAGALEHHITLTDGRTVTCLVFVSNLGQAPDCDWQGAR